MRSTIYKLICKPQENSDVALKGFTTAVLYTGSKKRCEKMKQSFPELECWIVPEYDRSKA